MEAKQYLKSLSLDEFHRKCEGNNLEANIYKTVRKLLSNYDNQEEIRKEFPKKTVERRNTGYAIGRIAGICTLYSRRRRF